MIATPLDQVRILLHFVAAAEFLVKFRIHQSGIGWDISNVISIFSVKNGVRRREWRALSYIEMLVTFHKILESHLESNFHSSSCMLPEKITASNLTVTDTLMNPSKLL